MTVAQALGDPDYVALKKFILDHTGLDYYLDKDEDLASRLSRRATTQRVGSLREYLRCLQDSGCPGEMDALVGELTIGETYFFRQREHFDFLRDRIFPDLLERNRDSRIIRIWSAGCATGAEPYSISMLLKLELEAQVKGWDIRIYGSDINLEFLDRARQARYEQWAFRETPEAIKQRCFRRDGRQWVLRPEFREGVAFEYHNLASAVPPPGPAHFDIIVCRNVTIYFGSAMIRRVVANFHGALTDGGWLLVGPAEPNAEIFAKYLTVSGQGTTAYRKLPPSAPLLPIPQFEFPAALPSPRPGTPETAPSPRRANPLPVSAPALSVDVARQFADRGEWDSAAALCRRILATDSLNATAHFTLGLILEHTGSAAEAELCLRRAIYLNRGFALAHYHLGICLQQGSREQARKAFENVLRLLARHPDDEVVEHGDGITVSELKELAKMRLEMRGGR